MCKNILANLIISSDNISNIFTIDGILDSLKTHYNIDIICSVSDQTIYDYLQSNQNIKKLWLQPNKSYSELLISQFEYLIDNNLAYDYYLLYSDYSDYSENTGIFKFIKSNNISTIINNYDHNLNALVGSHGNKCSIAIDNITRLTKHGFINNEKSINYYFKTGIIFGKYSTLFEYIKTLDESSKKIINEMSFDLLLSLIAMIYGNIITDRQIKIDQYNKPSHIVQIISKTTAILLFQDIVKFELFVRDKAMTVINNYFDQIVLVISPNVISNRLAKFKNVYRCDNFPTVIKIYKIIGHFNLLTSDRIAFFSENCIFNRNLTKFLDQSKKYDLFGLTDRYSGNNYYIDSLVWLLSNRAINILVKSVNNKYIKLLNQSNKCIDLEQSLNIKYTKLLTATDCLIGCLYSAQDIYLPKYQEFDLKHDTGLLKKMKSPILANNTGNINFELLNIDKILKLEQYNTVHSDWLKQYNLMHCDKLKQQCIDLLSKYHKLKVKYNYDANVIKKYQTICIVNESHYNLRLIVSSFINNLSSDWNHTIICTKNIYDQIVTLFKNDISSGVLTVNVIDSDKTTIDASDILLCPKLWVCERERVLIYDQYSLLSKTHQVYENLSNSLILTGLNINEYSINILGAGSINIFSPELVIGFQKSTSTSLIKKSGIFDVLSEYAIQNGLSNVILPTICNILKVTYFPLFDYLDLSMKVYFISNVLSGGAKKYIDDLVNLYSLDFTILSDNKSVMDCHPMPIDLIMVQHLIDTDIDISEIIKIKNIHNCQLVISIHDFKWFRPLSELYTHNDKTHSTYLLNDIIIDNQIIELFKIADKIIHPSKFTYDQYKKYFGIENFYIVDHCDIDINYNAKSFRTIDNNQINIGIYHDHSIYKGYNWLKLLKSKYDTYRGYNVKFLQVGLNIPRYDQDDFYQHLETHHINGLTFLNQWGETYCYALSYAINCGLPIIYSHVGAIGERLTKVTNNDDFGFEHGEIYDFNDRLANVDDKLYDIFTKYLDYIINNSTKLSKITNLQNNSQALCKNDFYDDLFKYIHVHNNNNDTIEYSVDMINPLYKTKNLVMITSKIKVSGYFTYPMSNNQVHKVIRSVYSETERYNQLINTINSVRLNIPDSTIILLDSSVFSMVEHTELSRLVDIFLNPFDNEEIINNCDNSKFKSIGELTQLKFMLNFIKINNISFDNLFKISGRYSINEYFNYKLFDNEFNIFKQFKELERIDGRKYYYTCFYKISNNNFIHYRKCILDVLTKCLKDERFAVSDLEVTLPKVIDKFETVKYLGLNCPISVHTTIEYV